MPPNGLLMYEVSATPVEIQAFMNSYGARLVDLTKERNSVPPNIINGIIGRLNYFVLEYRYPRPTENQTVQLTESEVLTLMRSTAEELASNLKSYRSPRIAAGIGRLVELNAVLPPAQPYNENE